MNSPRDSEPGNDTGGPGIEPAAVSPSADEVRAQLTKVVTSQGFKGSERQRRLLSLVVEETLAGRGDRLKEYVLAVEALDRPSSFDPRSDPGVRVEARRLRDRLAAYYESEGRDDGVVITLPKGGYVAAFASRPGHAAPSDSRPEGEDSEPAPAAPGATLEPGRRHRASWVTPTGVLLACALAAWGLWAWVRATPRTPTVAVLPFTNAGSEKDNEFFCFGLVEDVTTELAQTPGLRVISRTSATQFAGAQDIKDVGRRLHADYLVEGSVRRSGDRLRITAQLINAADGSHVWASAYDREMRDVLGTQSEIARAVAVALGARLAPAPASPRTASVPREAFELYQKGQYFLNTADKQAPEKALAYLQQAVAAAPDFAPARAALAAAYAKITLDRTAPLAAEIAQAKAEARRALQLDANQADAQALLAWIAFFYEWRWGEAEEGFRRSLAVNPNSTTALHRYSLLLLSTRRFDQALAMSRKALELDPLSGLVASNRTMLLLCARRFDEALAQGRSALDLSPRGFNTHTLMGSSYAAKGQFREAIAAYESALAIDPGEPDASCSLARALALSGRREEAARRAEGLARPDNPRPPSRYELAYLQAALGRADEALGLLARAKAAHETELVYLDVDPLFDPLRGDPRFKEFIRQLRASESR